MITRVTGLTLAVFLLAGTAGAQEHPHPPGQEQGAPMMGMMQTMGADMMETMSGSPGMILRLRGPLELSEQQVQRLEEIQRQVHEGHERHMSAAMTLMREAEATLTGDSPNLADYQAKLREAADHHVQAHVIMASGSLEARGVLTPEQQSHLRFGMRMMQQMMTGGMQQQGGGMGPEMMRERIPPQP